MVPTLSGTDLATLHWAAKSIVMMPVSMHSRAEYYRRRGLAAKERATQSTDLSLREALKDVTRHWLALAERVDWLDKQQKRPHHKLYS